MNAQIVALSKTVKDKALTAARDGLEVGTHPIDCLVRITGSIKVGEDTETDVRDTVNFKNAFVAILDVLKKRHDINDDLLSDLIGMAFRRKDANETIVALIDAEERDCTKVTGKKKKRGSVTTKLIYEFEEIEQKPHRPTLAPDDWPNCTCREGTVNQLGHMIGCPYELP